jgi:putative ABC transport system permease protein
MHALLRDIRFALRALTGSPGYAFVAVLTLALAIGANTAIFSAVNHVLLRPLPYPDSDQLIIAMETRPGMERMAVPYPNFLDYRARNTTLASAAAMGLHAMTLTGQGDPEQLRVQMYTHDYLPMLGVEPVLGRHFLPEEDGPGGARAVLLSHGLWTRRYAADPAILGRALTLDGGEWTVVGVTPADYRPFYEAAVFIPLGVRADEPAFRDRGARPELYLFGRMKPGVTLEQARADLVAIGDDLGQRFPDQVGASRPLVVALHPELVSEHRLQLLLLLGAVGCVLLIAAANVANLTLERAVTRQREMTIRAALGAGRWRLVRQMLVESTLLALTGGALGLLLALWGVDLLTAMLPQSPTFQMLGPIGIDARVLLFTVVVALGTGLLCGLVPALFAARQDLAHALKHTDHYASAGGRHLRARNLLVVGEVALALTLTVGAVLAMRSLAALQTIDLGFSPAGVTGTVITLSPPRYPAGPQIQQFWTEVQRRVAALPGVRAVSVASGAPQLHGAYDVVYPLGAPRTPDNQRTALVFRTDGDLLATLEIPLLSGRPLGPQDGPGTPPVVLIDRGLADELFPGQDPVGQRLQDRLSGQPSVEVVGVVGHVRNDSLDAPEERTPYQLYYSYRQLPDVSTQDMAFGQTMILLARADPVVADAGDPAELIPQVRAVVTAVDPLQPTWGDFVYEESVRGTLTPRRFTADLLAGFAAIALLLAALGLHAVMASAVAQRTRELGIRMALGAQPRAVVLLVVRQGMTLVAVGLLVGLLGALALTSALATVVAADVSATDPLTYVAVAVLLTCVGLLATWIPARRATRIDPMTAMRHD